MNDHVCDLDAGITVVGCHACGFEAGRLAGLEAAAKAADGWAESNEQSARDKTEDAPFSASSHEEAAVTARVVGRKIRALAGKPAEPRYSLAEVEAAMDVARKRWIGTGKDWRSCVRAALTGAP